MKRKLLTSVKRILRIYAPLLGLGDWDVQLAAVGAGTLQDEGGNPIAAGINTYHGSRTMTIKVSLDALDESESLEVIVVHELVHAVFRELGWGKVESLMPKYGLESSYHFEEDVCDRVASALVNAVQA